MSRTIFKKGSFVFIVQIECFARLSILIWFLFDIVFSFYLCVDLYYHQTFPFKTKLNRLLPVSRLWQHWKEKVYSFYRFLFYDRFFFLFVLCNSFLKDHYQVFIFSQVSTKIWLYRIIYLGSYRMFFSGSINSFKSIIFLCLQPFNIIIFFDLFEKSLDKLLVARCYVSSFSIRMQLMIKVGIYL